MTGHLLLIEDGIDRDRLARLVREHKLDRSRGALALSESDLISLKHIGLDLEIQKVADVLPLYGEKGIELFLEARRLVAELGEELSTPRYSVAFRYKGFSLWHLAAYELEQVVRNTLRKVKALQGIFKSEEWESVYVFESFGELWDIFRLVSSAEECTGQVERYSIPSGTVQLRRVSQRLVPVWSEQLLRDLWYSIKSQPRPRLRPLIPKFHPYVFVVDSYSTYLSTLAPVIKKVAVDSEVLVLNKGGVIRSQALQEQELNLAYCTQYLSLFAWPRVVRYTRKLKRAWKQLSTDEDILAALRYDGYKIWPVLLPSLCSLSLRFLPRLVLWIEAMKNLYESARPRAVIALPDRHGLARTTLELAKNYVIPSLTIQPALMSDSARYGPMYADRVAAIDHYSRQIYVKRGKVESERVVLTGLPRWDIMSQVMRQAKLKNPSSKVRTKLRIDDDTKFVTFAAQNLPIAHTWHMLTPVLSTVETMPDAFLVIKLHPADKHAADDYRARLSTCGLENHKAIVVDDIDTPTLLAASDLLITGFSNVALEAALLEKPVLIVNLTNQPDPLPFVENGIALGAYSEAEVEQKLIALLTDASTREDLKVRRKEYFAQNPQLLDGRATERVVTLLKEMTT